MSIGCPVLLQDKIQEVDSVLASLSAVEEAWSA
jgi:hypothetical protein